jgi:serine/threonine protein phosphatase PrpC
VCVYRSYIHILCSAVADTMIATHHTRVDLAYSLLYLPSTIIYYVLCALLEPEITEHTLGPDDTFMILASDGVWEFISSQEAVDKVAGSLDKGCMRATQVLIEAAAQRWREVEGDYRDGNDV